MPDARSFGACKFGFGLKALGGSGLRIKALGIDVGFGIYIYIWHISTEEAVAIRCYAHESGLYRLRTFFGFWGFCA